MVAVAACSTSACEVPFFLNLCDPADQSGRVRFFSSGDCKGLDSDMFRGHEWLTLLANRDLADDARFTDEQLDAVIEANRRTDYPKELLIHLDHGPVEYIDKLEAYHGHPDNQRFHFLLRRCNTYEDAHEEGIQWIRERSHLAVETWNSEQLEALTAIGQACHALQDSYSTAHSRRDRSNGWCIQKIKTAIGRDAECDSDEIERHDRQVQDRPGHTTVQDSLYEPVATCLEPSTADEVLACLKPEAERARIATRDYLAMMRELVTTRPDPAEVDAQLDAYFAAHFEPCLLDMGI